MAEGRGLGVLFLVGTGTGVRLADGTGSGVRVPDGTGTGVLTLVGTGVGVRGPGPHSWTARAPAWAARKYLRHAVRFS